LPGGCCGRDHPGQQGDLQFGQRELAEGEAALGAEFCLVLKTRQVIAAKAASERGEGPGEAGDVDPDADDHDGVWIEQDLEHAEIDAPVRPDVEQVVEEGDGCEAERGSQEPGYGGPTTTESGGRVPRDDGVGGEGEHGE
jgi:hypothetical protein